MFTNCINVSERYVFLSECSGDHIQLFARFLETEYLRHCVPSKVSSGLSSLPLPHVYVDGVVRSDQPTTQKLPSGHKLNGAQAYMKLLSFFTTLDISPRQLKDIAQKRLDHLLSQVDELHPSFVKGAMSRFAHLEKFSLNFFRLNLIWVSLLHTCFFIVYYYYNSVFLAQ